MADGLTRRQSLYRSVLAHDTEAIGHRIFSTVKSPWRAMRPLHGRLDTCRRNDANLLLNTKAAAELTRPARILAQPSVGDENRTFAFTRFHRCVMRVAVVDAKRCILSVSIEERAPATAGKRLGKVKRAARLRVETKRARHREIGMLTGHHPLGTCRRERFENRIRHSHRHSHPGAHGRRFRRTYDPARR